jgi:mRNA interferase HigB
MQMLERFCIEHGDVREQARAWVAEVRSADWRAPRNIREKYSSASFVAENQVYFNLKGDHYRLQVKISYEHQVVKIVWIGTHAEYSKKMKRGQGGR